MNRSLCLILIKLTIISGLSSEIYARTDVDTIPGNQLLFNGRIWRDLYTTVKEDQFLFSYEFLSGAVTINGNKFNNLKLRYDILNDEILTITDNGFILQLNKEMVDGFSIIYNSRIYEFSNLMSGPQGNLAGYVDVRYNGRTALYIKHKKEISKITVGKDYENFVQSDLTYVISDSIPIRIRNRKDFMVLLTDKRDAVKKYMRSNRLKVSKKSPDTYIPVLEYFDSLKP